MLLLRPDPIRGPAGPVIRKRDDAGTASSRLASSLSISLTHTRRVHDHTPVFGPRRFVNADTPTSTNDAARGDESRKSRPGVNALPPHHHRLRQHTRSLPSVAATTTTTAFHLITLHRQHPPARSSTQTMSSFDPSRCVRACARSLASAQPPPSRPWRSQGSEPQSIAPRRSDSHRLAARSLVNCITCFLKHRISTTYSSTTC